MGALVLHQGKGAPSHRSQVVLAVYGIALLAAPPFPGMAHHSSKHPTELQALFPVTVRVFFGAYGVDFGQEHQGLYWYEIES